MNSFTKGTTVLINDPSSLLVPGHYFHGRTAKITDVIKDMKVTAFYKLCISHKRGDKFVGKYLQIHIFPKHAHIFLIPIYKNNKLLRLVIE